MISVEAMTDEELSCYALNLLEKELGVLGMARFLRLARAGSGDYTRDRHLWLDGVTIDEIVRESQERYPRAAAEREAS